MVDVCLAEERRRNIEDLHDELKTLKRRHATSVKVISSARQNVVCLCVWIDQVVTAAHRDL